MTTVEKLLVQIFERKNSIIEQVKQQTELYSQHLASKLLIDGITPPSWLWNPNASDSEELNKEELISQLLRPYPQPSARFSVAHYPGYNNLVITGDNEEFCDGVFVEKSSFSKGLNRQDDPTVPTLSSDDHGECALDCASGLDVSVNSPEDQTDERILNIYNAPDQSVAGIQRSKSRQKALGECALNCAPGLDVSVNSPEDQTYERILNIYSAPDQSLAGIQRSKSRQKALELRSSKALAKSSLRLENSSDVVSSQIRFLLSATNQAGQNEDLPHLADPCASGSKSFEDRDLGEADCTTREMGLDAHSDRKTRSRKSTDVQNSVKGSFTLGYLPEDCKENAFSHVAKARRTESMPISNSQHADNYANKLTGLRCENSSDVVSSQVRFSLSASNQADQNEDLPQLADPCASGSKSCEERDLDEADCTSREMGLDAHSDRISRSRKSTEVPISVQGSFMLGYLPEDCKENAFSHVAKARRTESKPISNSQHSDDYANKLSKSAGPSAVCSQSCGDRRVDDTDFLSEDKEINLYTNKITSSKSSSKWQNCGCDSAKADSSSDNYQGIDIALMDLGDDLSPECVDRYMMKVNLSNVHNEGGDAPESMSEDFKKHKERGAFPYLSSVQQNACVDEVTDLEVASLSAKVDGGILAPSSAVSTRRINDSHEVSGLVKPSVGLFRRVTTSQTQSKDKESHQPVAYNENPSFRCTVSKSDCKQKSAEERLQNTSSGLSAPVCHGTHNIHHDDKNGNLNMENELVLHYFVDQSCSSSSSYYAEQRKELESQDSPTTSDSCAFVEPKQLDHTEIEEYNLKAFICKSGKTRLDKSPEKMSCSSFIPDVALDKGISGGANKLSLGKQSPRISHVSSKGDETYRDSFESDVQENPGTYVQASEDNTVPGLNCKISQVHHEADNMFSKIVDIPDTRIHPLKLCVEHGCESLPEQHMEEGDWSCKEKDKGQLVSSAPESKTLRLSHCHSSARAPTAESYHFSTEKVEMRNSIALDEIKQSPDQQSQVFSCLEGDVCSQHGHSSLGDNALGMCSTVKPHGENLSLERSFRHASMESWPQLKRRKVEHHQTHSFTTSPSLRMKKPQSIQRGPASIYLQTMEINLDTSFMEHVNKRVDVRISPEINSNLIEGIESTFLSQHGELTQVGSCYKEKNEHKNSSSNISSEKLQAALFSSLTMKESRNSQGCFVEERRASPSNSNHFDAIMSGDEKYGGELGNSEKNTDNPNSENLKHSNTLLGGVQSPEWEGGLHRQHSLVCPSNEDVQLADVDQSMPVFEGFIVDAQADRGDLNFAADGFDFDELNLPRTTLERASVLAEICRSASLDRPSCQFSSAFKFQGTQNLFQSAPDGVQLEQLDLGDTFPLNSDVSKHQSVSCSSDDYKDAFDRMPYSVSLAYSEARYGWSSRNQHASPVGKLWDRLSSHTGSSEKRLSSNPELMCFPIEEDPSISEENKTEDENAGDVQEEIDSSFANQCDKRQPLEDLTNLVFNMSVSQEEETLSADSVDLMSRKFSVTRTQERVHLAPKFQHKNKSETSEKQTSLTDASDGRKNKPSSIGANGIKKAKESMNNSISKPVASNKTSLKGQDQKLSLKESRRNNIVSNVSSFIPLVQQKQAATACAGKKEVKVKALEAAEAAKRLEQKKENERKQRKEALKLERAKLGEKNLRQMELEKKKKEEERKKKDADIIAKKRLREEEDRKEKEKKRMRLEARQQQRERDEKKRAEKAEKSKNEQMNSKKEYHDESKRQQSRETTGGDGVALQKAETKLILTGVVMNYEECGTSGLSCEAGKAKHTVDKSPRKEDFISQSNRGKSYEISPYQCSDEEDEEDDELPAKKYIPSWASKNSVAQLLPLQQELEPDVIFPPESFCSINEVLLPRKLQQNQVAA